MGRVSAQTGITIAAIAWLTIAPTAAFDGPKFRKGMWRFERATELIRKHPGMPAASFIRVEPLILRCVDPTESMKETFRPVNEGNCHAKLPERKSNTYFFPLRCDYIGPVRTKIVVESDSAYLEMHESTVSSPTRKEVVFARRIGDCGGYDSAEAEPLQLMPAIQAGLLSSDLSADTE